MVLHLLPERPAHAGGHPARSENARPVLPSGARAGFVVGRSVGNSVVRHRVTRRLRAVVRAELDRLPATADLVVRARPEAASAGSAELHRDLSRGLDRLLGPRADR
ncbi:ribonuclease P protein component [Blastococcus aggregatus]|uniref:Ribonuclease P protein component n=2 Tax=Blastococcus aggregatus TaxID=38502 RepID=A0A285VE44_9ACTN|nr:ribonuclease P protein component [Blastococcus aggregatus]